MSHSDKKSRALILLLASWAGLVFLAAIIAVKLPFYLGEQQRLRTLKTQVTNRQEIEARMNAFIDAFKTRIESINSQIASRRRMAESSTFSRLPATELTEFIDNLPRLVASSGVRLVNLGYKAKENHPGFVDQPFELNFNGQYQQMRQMLHALETHPAGIRIENLEFLTLDDINHEAQLRLQCRVRFQTNG